MFRFAIGEMEMKPEEFWNLTLLEYSIKSEGYFRKMERYWDRTRFLASILINVNKTKGQPIDPKELIPLSIDDDFEVEWEEDYFMSVDDLEKLKQKWNMN